MKAGALVALPLGASGWEIVDRAHTRSPSFLLDPETSAAPTV